MDIIKQVLEVLVWNAPVFVKNVREVLQIVKNVSMDSIMIIQHANNVRFHVINVVTQILVKHVLIDIISTNLIANVCHVSLLVNHAQIQQLAHPV